MSWLAVIVICSIALYAAEHRINKATDPPFDAALMGRRHPVTVGYGEVLPITPEGRLAEMLVVIGLFSAITATAPSYLISTGRPADASSGGQVVLSSNAW